MPLLSVVDTYLPVVSARISAHRWGACEGLELGGHVDAEEQSNAVKKWLFYRRFCVKVVVIPTDEELMIASVNDGYSEEVIL